MTLERFGFDVEMLYLARSLGYRVREVPAIWRNSPQTRVHAFRDSASMAGDLLRIRWNDLRGRYDRPRQRASASSSPCHGETATPPSVKRVDRNRMTH
jgi:hypothetical protein